MSADHMKIEPMTNEAFLEVIRKSFETYLKKDTSRSPQKLIALHGHIAEDLGKMFGKEYTIKSQGFGDGKEYSTEGKYYKKKADITVLKDDKPVAGYAVKFVMRNYSQNSNNYFENMLGETANIRSAKIPYFQIFIVFDTVPYYKNDGSFYKYEKITENNIQKYVFLSKEDSDRFYHVPNKTLIAVLKLKEAKSHKFSNSAEYAKYYRSVIGDNDILTYSDSLNDTFGSGVILNNYNTFIKATVDIVLNKNNNK